MKTAASDRGETNRCAVGPPVVTSDMHMGPINRRPRAKLARQCMHDLSVFVSGACMQARPIAGTHGHNINTSLGRLFIHRIAS